MKLATFHNGFEQRVGIASGECLVDVTLGYEKLLRLRGQSRCREIAHAILPPDMKQILEGGNVALLALAEVRDMAEPLARAACGASPAEDFLLRRDAVRLRAPISNPQKIICVGLNYRDHAAEANMELPKVPMTFGKFADAIVGPDDPIVIPNGCSEPDWEIELTLVMGERARYVKASAALDYVAGYMIGNDVSARDFQAKDPQMMRGKACQGFAPIGPWIVLKDEVPEPHRLALETRVNGKVMQSSNTDQLIHGVPAIIEWITRYLTLVPGDLVMTGTPAGVGKFCTPPVFLKAGDLVEMSIEGLGTLRNPVIGDESAY